MSNNTNEFNTLDKEHLKNAWNKTELDLQTEKYQGAFYFEFKKLTNYFKWKWINISGENFLEIFFQETNNLRLKYWVSNISTDKWITLTEETFFKEPEKMINLFIDNFGFIPEELYTKLIFLTKNNFSLAARFFNLLKEKEKKSKDKNIIDDLRKARNLFLKYTFLDKKGKNDSLIKWICESVKKENQITLDTNWVWIRILDKKDNIISHFPYQLLDDELINYWLENNWIDENIFLEIKNRKLKNNGNFKEDLVKIEERQLDILLEKIGVPTNIQIEKKVKIISEKVIFSPDSLAKIIIENNLIVPDVVFNFVINNNNPIDAIYYLFNFSEQFNVIITNEDIIEHNRDYLLAYTSKNRFSQRKKIANQDTRLYTWYKAIDKAISIKLPNNWLDFYILKSEVDQETNLWFTQVITQKWISRALLNEKKHLSWKSKDNFWKLKQFSKQELENIEVFYSSLFISRKALNSLEQNLKDNKISFNDNYNLLQNVLVFILNYFPEHFQKLSNISKKILINWNKEDIDSFIKYTKIIFEKLRFSLDNYITTWQDLDVLENTLTKKTISFNNEFLEKIKTMWLPNYSYDESLCLCWEKVSIVELKRWLDKETFSIDYFSELSAINALNLKQNKQMIVVSWWCKEVSQNWVSSLDVFSWAILNIAIRHNANLSIPWTQSWIWVSMSKKYLEYKSKSKFVGSDNSMKMFSVSTRNNMADNELTSRSKYAPCPIDQIYIPCDADWDKKWADVINAWYFQFIEWAEQIYNRLDKNKQRLHVIWNWWLFTIAEVSAALKNNAKVLFVEWTWRFADFASSILSSKDLWSIVFDLYKLKTYNDFYRVLLNTLKIIKNDLDSNTLNEIVDKDLWNLELLEDFFANFWDKEINWVEDLFNDLVVYIENKWLNITPKQVLYQIYIVEFLKLCVKLPNKPVNCKLEELEVYLEKSLG